jgi:hypothetical protein
VLIFSKRHFPVKTKEEGPAAEAKDVDRLSPLDYIP